MFALFALGRGMQTHEAIVDFLNEKGEHVETPAPGPIWRLLNYRIRRTETRMTVFVSVFREGKQTARRRFLFAHPHRVPFKSLSFFAFLSGLSTRININACVRRFGRKRETYRDRRKVISLDGFSVLHSQRNVLNCESRRASELFRKEFEYSRGGRGCARRRTRMPGREQAERLREHSWSLEVRVQLITSYEVLKDEARCANGPEARPTTRRVHVKQLKSSLFHGLSICAYTSIFGRETRHVRKI